MADMARRAGAAPPEVEWLDRWGRAWRGVLDPPSLLPEPAGDVEEIDIEITCPDGGLFDEAALRAAHVGQPCRGVPLRGVTVPVPGTVTGVVVAPGRRTATLTVRIDDVPAWRAALPSLETQ